MSIFETIEKTGSHWLLELLDTKDWIPSKKYG